jgi:hypothetical protein
MTTPSGNPATDERIAIELLEKKSPLGLPWIESDDVVPLVVFLGICSSGTGERHLVRGPGR